MPPVAIPYARSQPYDNSQYVRAMADLMLRRGDVAAAAALQRGQNTQQAWDRVGNITMATFAGIGKQRDEERDRAMRQANLEREYAMKQQEMQQRAEERDIEQAYRRRQEEAAAETRRESKAERFTEGTSVGTVVPRDVYGREIRGTGSAAAYEEQPGMAARLPATPLIESAGIPSYSTAARRGRVQDPVALDPGLAEDEFIGPTQRTMSRDIAARPEGFRRVASQPELVQLENLRRQEEAAAALREDRKIDNARLEAERIARKDAADATAEYRRLRLAQGRQPTQASLALQVAGGDPKKALDLIKSAQDDPRKLARFSTLSGEYQRSPLVAAADRTVILDDAITAIRQKPTDPPSQVTLAYSFVQVIDTYQSAVREGELKNIGTIDSLIGQLQRTAEGVLNQKQIMNADTALAIADTSERIIKAIESARGQKESDYAARAKVMGVGDMWDEYRAIAGASRRKRSEGGGGTPTSPFNDPAAQPGKKP